MNRSSASGEVSKHVCFMLGGQELGVPVRAVKETLPLRPLTRLCLVPPFVAGLMNLRGEVVAVLDLGLLFGLGSGPHEPDRRRHPDAAILVLRPSQALGALGARAQGRAAAGLLVERLLGVRDVPAELVQPAPPTLPQESAVYLRGVAALGDPPRPLLLIDPEKVLTSERLRPYRRDRSAGAASS